MKSSTEPISEYRLRSAIQAAFSTAQAALIARLRDIDKAEDAMQEAVLKALQHWPRQGIPAQPAAWLLTTAMNVFRDQYRRDSRTKSIADTAEEGLPVDSSTGIPFDALEAGSDEDVLRLIFMCCHPSIAVENQLALCLKLLMGFSQEEIAKALLISSKTLEQRLTRAKRKIASTGISFDLPRTEFLPQRLSSVRQVLYLIFNEGYHSVGEALINKELCRQAIQLSRALCRGFADAENFGLLSLMLFHDARSNARLGESGELITLDRQNRSLWKLGQIDEADVLLQKALRRGEVGVYQLQSAIAGVHSLASSPDKTDWEEIVGLYERLLRLQSGPVIRLNYAVALMMLRKLKKAEEILFALEAELQNYSSYYAALARLHTLSERPDAAAAALKNAVALTGSLIEKRHYQIQLDAMEPYGG